MLNYNVHEAPFFNFKIHSPLIRGSDHMMGPIVPYKMLQ